jgi:N-acetylglucosaminyl-diphospho-decaprenol L-rhamnosyltransferase
MTVVERASRPSLIEVKPPAPAAREARVAAPRAVDVTLIVVTWNSERWIDRCLRAIPAACEGLHYEVVIYDNASSDGTLSHIRDVDAQQLVRSENNDGFAAGVNRAATLSRGRYVFLLNPDCELGPRALTTLLEFLDANPAAAAAAPLLSGDDGDDQREFQLRELPTLRSLASEVLLHRKASHREYRDLDLTRPQRVEQPAAAALLIRRSVFDEVGPLDEQFSPAWFEDVDYCQRLARAGKEVFVVPAARGRHFGGASLEHMPFAEFVDVWYRNMLRYARKWMTPGEAEAVRWTIIAGMLLRCIAAAAGLAHPEAGRRVALRAYAHVLERAFARWETR